MSTWTPARDLALRRAAIAWLTVRTNDGLESIPSEDLRDFVFEGERIPLIDAQRGIRKPAVLDAALSIRTVYRPEGATRPYEDSEGADGFIRYKWRGTDANHPENRALRVAMERRLPPSGSSASAQASTSRSSLSTSSEKRQTNINSWWATRGP